MHILLISFDYSVVLQKDEVPGDTQERHIKYARTLRRYYPDGHITMIVQAPSSFSFQQLEFSDSLTVYPVPCPRWKFVVSAGKLLRKLLKTQKFDLVSTQTPFDDGCLGVWMRMIFGIPLNVQMQSSFLNLNAWIRERPIIYYVFNTLGKIVTRYADTIRTVSYEEKKRLEQIFPKMHGKIFSLHPLVNVEIFNKPITDDEIRQIKALLKSQNLEENIFLLFVGRLVIEKNLPTLLKAFSMVRQQFREAVLVIAGNGPLRTRLERLASQLGLEGNVLWLGNMPMKALRGWYALSRMTLLPSFHEGLPKVVIESYLMGTPVIAAPFVSAAELIQNTKTGFITQSFTDPEEISEKMSHLITSSELAKVMGESGRRHIQNYLLSEDVYMKHLIDIWEQTRTRGKTRT